MCDVLKGNIVLVIGTCLLTVLFAFKVPEFCPALDEDGVREHSFDLILAFDEVYF